MNQNKMKVEGFSPWLHRHTYHTYHPKVSGNKWTNTGSISYGNWYIQQ
jgi:hypothetical protein